MEKLRKFLVSNSSYCVNLLGSAGGLGLWWRHEVEIQILGSCRNYIDSIVIYPKDGFHFRGFWFYGPPEIGRRCEFWESLKGMDWKDGTPWLCIGDFNDFLWHYEKHEDNALWDLGYKGQKFTWRRIRYGEVYVQERLDCALINEDLLKNWPESHVVHRIPMGSDHCPLSLHLSPKQVLGPKLFRFESF
ncbi:unnamed protein product [Prunus armeniaca]